MGLARKSSRSQVAGVPTLWYCSACLAASTHGHSLRERLSVDIIDAF
jgi:hypothetical protein